MAERIAAHLPVKRFGVRSLYLCGSTKNATAGPQSDIDLIVHFTGSDEQQQLLTNWFEGWSLSLAEMNYLRTGYHVSGMLDLHFVTDLDIETKSSFAAKINAVTDAARPLRLGMEQLSD